MSMRQPPIGIFSISFEHSICLYDPATDRPSNDAPQWRQGGHHALLAYPRGSALSLNILFIHLHRANLGYDIKYVYAEGNGLSIAPTSVALGFDPDTGVARSPIELRCTELLPSDIGEYTYTLHWYACCTKDGRELPPCAIGETTHTFAITKSAPAERPDEGLHPWVYEPIMRWSCQWAHGQTNDKNICDALLNSLSRSGLCYGIEGRGTGLRGLLLRGGGTCGAWHQLFQHLAHCQGVAVVRRDLTLLRRKYGDTVLWTDAIATDGGINQPYPAVDAEAFLESAEGWPHDMAALKTTIACRYAFEGQEEAQVGQNSSTHAVNFFRDSDGQSYLYDPSFGVGPVPVDSDIPPAGVTIWQGAQVAIFKQRYLDRIFPYLRGLFHGQRVLVPISHIPAESIALGWSANTD